jgi:hypothetical protein
VEQQSHHEDATLVLSFSLFFTTKILLKPSTGLEAFLRVLRHLDSTPSLVQYCRRTYGTSTGTCTVLLVPYSVLTN